MSPRENKFYLYLAIIALISWWLVNLTDVDEAFHGQTPTHSPDYFSKGYTKWEMNELGKLKNKLLADEVKVTKRPSAEIDGQYSSSFVFMPLPTLTGLKGIGFLTAFTAHSQSLRLFAATSVFLTDIPV